MMQDIDAQALKSIQWVNRGRVSCHLKTDRTMILTEQILWFFVHIRQ